MLAASLEQISIGLLLIRKYNIFFVREASSPCNGNHFSSIYIYGQTRLHYPDQLRARVIRKSLIYSTWRAFLEHAVVELVSKFNEKVTTSV